MIKQTVILCIIIEAFGLSYADSVMTLNHPDKNGYAQVVPGSEKHKYGYELKDNKHFHHTTTEKDGVRLGCYGYELEGKKYSTQYVADSRGYRTVTNQDLITVYPKSGGKRKASFVDELVSENVQYVFPEGCKGIDVLIDNSSRLRNIDEPEDDLNDVQPKLPVTLKTTYKPYVYSTPPNTYIPPGPLHIYTPNQINGTPNKPPTVYLPPKGPNDLYLPPPTVPKPANTYLPPATTTKAKPTITYLPPTTPKPPNTYLPPKDPSNIYLPPNTTPKPSHIYLPPVTQATKPKPKPPLSPNIAILRPPVLPECDNSCCQKKSGGMFVIPIPLKNFNSNECCARTAELILPLNQFDHDSVKKLKESMIEEIDAKELIRNILKSLL
ncbi:CLUMA_CG015247, isoform A [Clunio marinus]|uniref:CLUMA_CG015247, isoform A n=1 Tax=Clunio marinus TaxID=568069 RepID=A0A1J1IQV6_9DIPT|nr:CLUMA_CG015247, isoform A [Clunio marinus]